MRLDTRLESELPRLLPGFLPTQRWFGGKAREIQAVEVEDAVQLADSPGVFVLTVAVVRYTDGDRERYVLLLAFPGAQTNLPIVGRVGQSAPETWAVEAATDADAALALLRGFARPREVPMLRGGVLLFADAGAEAEQGVAQAAQTGSISALGAEQSNTSVRLDRTLVFKLFRKLDHGENPEVEVGRFLTRRTAFRAMPVLRGSLTYISGRGEVSTVGVLQDWVDNHGDGWTHVVALLRSPAEPDRELLPQNLLALGSTTADFHAALGTETEERGFAPEPVTVGDVQAWRSQLLVRAARTFGLIERCLPHWAPHEQRLGELVLGLRDGASALAEPPQPTADAFHLIRIHGDYHLGQVLKTPAGFVVIDFEGEPSRPIAERRLKQCALKDVAGMIRSFEYAVDSASGPDSTVAERTARAERLRESFLEGYFARMAAYDAAFLPRDPRATAHWIGFFEFEKALYEVEYEINNRPHWVRVPLEGMLHILRRRA